MSTPILQNPARRGGRGLRPWLLIPKLLCVCVALGALVTGTVIWVMLGAARADWLFAIEYIIFARVMVPALVGAIFFGVLLFLQHPRIFIRMRWLQTKLATAAIFLPVLHVWVTSQFFALSRANSKADSATLITTLGIAIVTFVVLIVLGRQKLRLGQDWAKDFTRRR